VGLGCTKRIRTGRRFASSAMKSVRPRRGSYYVYMLICEDMSYYTGYSSAPSARFVAHAEGRGARYTRMHKPKRIAYLERHRTRRAAMRREREIKALTHEEKRSLADAAGKSLKGT
jgi:putative endonuclease